MKELLKSVKQHYDSKPIGAQAALYYAVAPQSAKLPYITYFLVSNSPERAFGIITYERPLLQFSIWSGQSSPTQACELYELLRAAFDDAVWSVTGYSHIRTSREMSNLLADPETGWHYQVDYKILTEED